ncbi:MAG: DUF2378 family protein [Archangium sp.]|nr:DUF2378 family protein [Archangium sp.]
MGDNLPAGEGVIYRHSVEALLNHVVKRRSLMTARELAEFGLEKPRDVDKDTWIRLLRTLARKLDAQEDVWLEKLGAAMLEGYADGFVGRSLFLVLKLMGPRRALLRMAENFKTADNVTEVTATARGETHVEIVFNDIGKVPTYVRGLLLEAMTTMGLQKPTVTFEELPNGHTKFDARW